MPEWVPSQASELFRLVAPQHGRQRLVAELLKGARSDRCALAGHQAMKEGDVVEGEEAGAEHFVANGEVAEDPHGVLGAGRAGAVGIEGLGGFLPARIAHVDAATAGVHLGVAAVARGGDAIEEIRSAGNSLKEV